MMRVSIGLWIKESASEQSTHRVRDRYIETSVKIRVRFKTCIRGMGLKSKAMALSTNLILSMALSTGRRAVRRVPLSKVEACCKAAFMAERSACYKICFIRQLVLSHSWPPPGTDLPQITQQYKMRSIQ